MGQRRNAESVANFVILFLLILQNCGKARTQTEIEQELLQHRRDGLAKFEFSAAQPVKDILGGSHTSQTSKPNIAPPNPLYVFNFAKIYETLYAQLVQPTTGDQQQRRGRGLRQPQAQLLWEGATTRKPFSVLEQLQLELEEKLKHRTTVKPFSVLEHLTLEQVEQLRRKTPNVSFNIFEALQMEQEQHASQLTTMKPFHVLQQLEQDLHEHENAFEVLQPVAAQAAEPLEEHKSAPTESSRAKDSQKRKRKRIQRRRKRIRRRRKRKRRRGKKKRKKKRNKKDKKKDQKRKKRRKKPEMKPSPFGQQAHLIFANPTRQPYYPHHHYPHEPNTLLQLVTTKRPATTKAPFNKIKYLLRHNVLFKKKKKEWFNHVGHVLYPFIKFVVFFTVLNPFTLGVFLFTLISPVVFGFLGFVALSVLVKPFLHIVFGVKSNVDSIDRRRYLAHKRAEQLKLNLRPVTIHKHFYQQKPLHSTPPQHHPPLVDWRRQTAPLAQQPQQRHNPLLPEERTAMNLL